MSPAGGETGERGVVGVVGDLTVMGTGEADACCLVVCDTRIGVTLFAPAFGDGDSTLA